MKVETQDPAVDVYFRAIGTIDNGESYNKAVTSSVPVNISTTKIEGISLFKNIGEVTISGNLSGTINGSELTTTDNEWRINIHNYDWSENYKTYVNADGSWSVNVPESETALTYGVNLENRILCCSNDSFVDKISLSVVDVDGIDINIDLVQLSGTLDLIIDDVTQDLSNWDNKSLYFYTDTSCKYEYQIGHSSFGNSNTWSVLLPVQSPATDIYVTFNGIDESSGYPGEEYSNLEAGVISSVGSTMITDQALVVNEDIVTVSGSLSGTINGSELTTADNEWRITIHDDDWSENYGTYVNADGSWSVNVPKPETAKTYQLRPGSDLGHDVDYQSISISDSDISGIYINLDLVQITGTFDFVIDNEVQDLSTQDWSALTFRNTSYNGTQIGYVDISDGSNTWSVLLPVQSPAADIYVTFSTNDSSGNDYYDLEAGVISSVGSTMITDQALVAEESFITVSGNLSGTINGSELTTADNEWRITIHDDDWSENYGTYVNADGSWSVNVPKPETAKTYQLRPGSDLGHDVDYQSISISDSDISGIYINLDLVQITGTFDFVIDNEVQDLSTQDWSALTFRNTSYNGTQIGYVDISDGSNTWSVLLPVQRLLGNLCHLVQYIYLGFQINLCFRQLAL